MICPRPEFSLFCFDNFVQPVLLYGTEVWVFHKSLDDVNLSCCARARHIELLITV